MALISANTGSSGLGSPHKRPRRFTPADYLVFLISCVQFVNITLVGVITAADILLILSFVSFALQGKFRIESRLAWKFLILGLLFLASQIATDIVRHTSFMDYARGWSNIGLTLVNFSVLCTLLYGRPRRLVIFGWGTVLGQFLQIFFYPDPVQDVSLWKFGFSFPVTLAIALIASRKDCRGNLPIILMGSMGVANIILAARNAGGICIVTALYLAVTHWLRRKTAGGAKLKIGLVAAMAITAVLGVVGTMWFYRYATESGYLGDDAREKYMEQSSGKYGVLLGGRPQLLATIPAIIDSPILGHGSWARDPGYVIEMRQALLLLGYNGALEMSPDELTDGLIPTHSFLLGAWVYAGVLGAVFWAWTWLMIVRSLLRIYPSAANMLPLMAYFVFLLIWDILFSPFGLDRRSQVPYYLLMIMTYYEIAIRSVAQRAVVRTSGNLKPALSPGL
jgi:hypothetical protein